MNCEKCLNELSAYIDNEISATEKNQIEKHLNECENCRREYEFLKNMILSAAQLPDEDLPPDFEEKLHKKLIAEKKNGRMERKGFLWGLKPIPLIAAGFLLVMIIRLGLNPPDFKNSSDSSDMEKSETISNGDKLLESKRPEFGESEESALKAQIKEDGEDYRNGEDACDIISSVIITDRVKDKDGMVTIDNNNIYCMKIVLNTEISLSDFREQTQNGYIYIYEISEKISDENDVKTVSLKIKSDNIVTTIRDIKELYPNFIIEILEVFEKEDYNYSEITIEFE